MSDEAELEREIVAGAIAALRRRAARQRQRAADWTITGANGVRIVAGEGRIAERIAQALEEASDDLTNCEIDHPLHLSEDVIVR